MNVILRVSVKWWSRARRPVGYAHPLIEPYVQFSRIRLTVWNL